MRITRLKIENIGGLRDCEIELPDYDILALVGANGTGKSKMLACLLSPWTRTIPLPGDTSKKRLVSVTIHFDETEAKAIEEYSRQSGWNESVSSGEVVYETSVQPVVGSVNVTTNPFGHTRANCLQNDTFLQANPTLNLVFLPAERRLVANPSAAVALAQLAEEVGLQRTAESRASAYGGKLDDGEFESYAKALCVSGSLLSEVSGSENIEATKWDALKAPSIYFYSQSS